jgi:peptide-methionine (R)-S-oxide reductase
MKKDEWKEKLTPEQYAVLREKGTEAPFTGEYNDFWKEGYYTCVACGNKLFVSNRKFDHGCGWPSFDKPANPESIYLSLDKSHGMVRTEVLCDKCGGHLGHIFMDGPTQLTDGTPASGMRFCINSIALDFVDGEDKKDSTAS